MKSTTDKDRGWYTVSLTNGEVIDYLPKWVAEKRYGKFIRSIYLDARHIIVKRLAA